MAKNDVVLLDGIIDRRIAELLPSDERDEVFEFLVMEETLKDYDLSRDEIETGWIDGRDDGGFDGFYIFVNGHLIEESEDFVWPRSNAAIDVWLITCKHHPTFRQATLDNVLATVQELFDLSLSDNELKGSYSENLLFLRNLFAIAYRKLSIGNPILRFHFVYASRGDTTDVGASVAARSRQLQTVITTLFSSCSAVFNFVGATQLVQSHRKTKTFSLDLPFLEHLATGRNSYVLLVRLEDYWKFVSDESGSLRRYLFDSNVRDYLGETGVNNDIAQSLADEKAPDFWWLNNGVTILATNATIPGKTIQLQDIQIVNGLQTTETIYRHFQSGITASRHRALLVKILVSSDPHARDLIIRATNNQSPVELAALHATDKIQRDIEAILERHEWYYERRRNYYRNIGKPHSRLVTPIYIASAAVTLIMKNPRAGTRLRTKFMRSQAAYDAVFSAQIPIEIWPVLVDVFKAVEVALVQVVDPDRRRERFLSNWRPLVALLVVARRLGTFDYNFTQLLEFKKRGTISKDEVAEAWNIILSVRAGIELAGRPKPSFVALCCKEAAKRYSILAHEVVGRRSLLGSGVGAPVVQPVTAEFILQVDTLLPDQPWKQGLHSQIAEKLNAHPKQVQDAIQQLIAQGKRYAQRDGVVYDHTGALLMVDPDRVASTSSLDKTIDDVRT